MVDQRYQCIVQWKRVDAITFYCYLFIYFYDNKID